jgi:hypothetical protein
MTRQELLCWPREFDETLDSLLQHYHDDLTQDDGTLQLVADRLEELGDPLAGFIRWCAVKYKSRIVLFSWLVNMYRGDDPVLPGIAVSWLKRANAQAVFASGLRFLRRKQ